MADIRGAVGGSTLRSVANNRLVTAEGAGADRLIANRISVGAVGAI